MTASRTYNAFAFWKTQSWAMMTRRPTKYFNQPSLLPNAFSVVERVVCVTVAIVPLSYRMRFHFGMHRFPLNTSKSLASHRMYFLNLPMTSFLNRICSLFGTHSSHNGLGYRIILFQSSQVCEGVFRASFTIFQIFLIVFCFPNMM